VAITISVVAVAVRFIDLNQPFIDDWSWRQGDVASIARNYLHNGFDFAHPQIDWAGGEPGYVGTEFPVLPFTAAICYKFLGTHEWIGRLQSVIFFAASLPFFFLLVRQVSGATAAVWALFFYSFAPLNMMASRCFMPDVPSLSLAIIGLYFFLRWTENDERKFLLASAVSISLSILIKLPNVIIGAPLFYLAVAAVSDGHRRGQGSALSLASQRGRLLRWELWLFGMIALVPAAVWYWHACQIAQTFYPYHVFGAGGVRLMSAKWYLDIAAETIMWSLTPVLVVLAVCSVFARESSGRAALFHAWLAATILFIIIVGYGNRHPWYRLPLVPIVAAYGGAVCAWIGARFSRGFKFKVTVVVIVVVFGVFCYAGAQRFYRETGANLRLVGLELLRVTPQKSLIIAADYGDPTVFYYAERRGWHFMEDEGIYNGHPENSAAAIADLETLRRRGATHFVVYTGTLWWLDYFKEFAQHLDKTASLIETNPKFKIFSLSPRNENK
jgi:hypothetical protein